MSKNPYDDSNESFFLPTNLGRTNFASGWTSAGIFRYTSVCTQIVNSGHPNYRKYRILDVGCSTATFFGFFTDSYVVENKPKICYTGLEFRQNAVDRANELFQERPDKYENIFNCIQMDVCANTLPEHGNFRMQNKTDGKYDCIIMAEILEHIGKKNAIKLIKQARKLLIPGGMLVVSSPNPRKQKGEKFVWPENHLYEFTQDEMEIACIKNGFGLKYTFGWLFRKNTDKLINELFLTQLQTISPGLGKSIYAHLNPEHAMCYTMIFQ